MDNHVLSAVLSGKIRNDKKTTTISGTVKHEFTFYSSQKIATDDNIQNYILIGEAKFSAKLCELAKP
jgi:hypothetical protein